MSWLGTSENFTARDRFHFHLGIFLGYLAGTVTVGFFWWLS